MAVGVLVGAGTGAVTKPSDVNLGKPPWANNDRECVGARIRRILSRFKDLR